VPCYHCGTRQTDPSRGPSLWKRGVVAGGMVLVCPDCQRTHDWVADLDHCPSCGSAALGRALGDTTCKSCGAVVASPAAEPTATEPVAGGAPGLSEDVAAALERTLHSESD
jgi:hypothetical protein